MQRQREWEHDCCPYPELLINIVRPWISRLWLEHFACASAFQTLEHAPFFRNWKNIAYLPSAIIYAYIHALVVVFALMSLHKVSLEIQNAKGNKWLV